PPEGAENLASITAVILGMLGGVFFPIESAGGALAAASVITPHYWFLRGLGDLAGGAPWTNAFPAAAVLIGMAVVLGLAAGWGLNRRFAGCRRARSPTRTRAGCSATGAAASS